MSTVAQNLPNPISKPKRTNNIWIALVIVVFVIIYAASLTFVFIEGDDAREAVYHAFGRRLELAAPYNPDQAMATGLLSLVPANIQAVRVAMMGASSILAVCMTLLIIALAFEWLGENVSQKKWILALVVLLASPEFFYLGLVYLPSIAAMAFVLGSHLILRHSKRSTIRWRSLTGLVLAIVCFGIGIGFRWDIVTYGGIIALDILLDDVKSFRQWRLQDIQNGFIWALSWGVLALACSLLVIKLSSGQNLGDIFHAFVNVQSHAEQPIGAWNRTISVFTIAGYQSLFTPAFVILSVVGFVWLAYHREKLVLITVVGLILVLPFIRSGVPKDILPAVPGLVACAVMGFIVLCYRLSSQRLKLAARIIIVALLLFPWLIGIRMTYNDTAYGPGFQMQAYDRPVSRNRIGLALSAGVSIPTPEGLRAGFGHLWVLLGQWRSFYNDQWDEQTQAIQQAILMHIPYLRQNNYAWASAGMLDLGYMVEHKYKYPDANFTGYRFTNGQEAVTVFGFDKEDWLTQHEHIAQLRSYLSQDKVVMCADSSIMRELFKRCPQALEKINTVCAVTHLNVLNQETF
ncbi:MAG: hypothetical protein ABI947_25150 [Chloroflexota bacterium]